MSDHQTAPRKRRIPFLAKSFKGRSAFTILELATAILIVLILGVISFQGYASLQPRLASTRCSANLRNLHVSADLFVQEHRTWPQIQVSGQTPEQYATAWIAALRPYGASPEGWVCPTTQSRFGNPNLNDPANVRIDYLPTPFSRGPQIPYKWANQPWFVEKFDEHLNGNLMTFPDGHVESLQDVLHSDEARFSRAALRPMLGFRR